MSFDQEPDHQPDKEDWLISICYKAREALENSKPKKDIPALWQMNARALDLLVQALDGKKPSMFDGSKNDPLIKNDALKQWEEIPAMSRFSLFTKEEVNALEAAIFSIISTAVVKKEYVEIVRHLQWEIRLEQERIALCSK